MSNINIYYFTADWCKPCQSISNSIDILNNKYDTINIYKIDIANEENNDICEKFNIQKIPSFLFFRKGEYICRFDGTNIKGIEEIIEELIKDNLIKDN